MGGQLDYKTWPALLMISERNFMGPRVVKVHQIDWKRRNDRYYKKKNPKFSIPDFGTGVGNKLPPPAPKTHSHGYLKVKVLALCCKYILPDGSVSSELFVRWIVIGRICLALRLVYVMGTAEAQWLRCCAINRNVAGSIPAGVTGIFHCHNLSDRTMAVGSTQPPTEMSTSSISWG